MLKRPAAKEAGSVHKRPASCVEEVEEVEEEQVAAPATDVVATESSADANTQSVEYQPVYRQSMKARRFNSLWQQGGLPAEAAQLVAEAEEERKQGLGSVAGFLWDVFDP